MNEFSLDGAFQNYIQKVGYAKLDPASNQYAQLKAAFYAGMGEMFVFMVGDIPEMDEEKATETIDSIAVQFEEFVKNLHR